MVSKVNRSLNVTQAQKNRALKLHLQSRRNLGPTASCVKVEKQLIQLYLKYLKGQKSEVKNSLGSGRPAIQREIGDKFDFKEFMRSRGASLKHDKGPNKK